MRGVLAIEEEDVQEWDRLCSNRRSIPGSTGEDLQSEVYLDFSDSIYLSILTMIKMLEHLNINQINWTFFSLCH